MVALGQVGIAGIFGLTGIALHGCGGGGGDGDKTTTTEGPTTTTQTYSWDISTCDGDKPVKECIDFLNTQYMGYDENDDTSPVGVTIRGQGTFNQPWFHCGGKCWNGQPDCYTAASLLNHKIMLCTGDAEGDTAQCHKKGAAIGSPAMPMLYKVGIVFQPDAIEKQLTKCSWHYDGSAFMRVNGGCGSPVPGVAPTPEACDNKGSAYYDICPDTEKPIQDDYTCQTVTREDCTVTTEPLKYPHTCYWKGPAFYSDTRAPASTYPANMTEGDGSGVRKMMKQRMTDQNEGGVSRTGKTSDGTNLQQYWDEITIDGKVMMEMLKWQPKAVIAAVMYQKGETIQRKEAQQYADQMKTDYGINVHVVSMDVSQKVEGTQGPFGEAEPITESEIV